MSPTASPNERLAQALAERFGTPFSASLDHGAETLAGLAEHRSHRHFLPRPVAPDLLRLLLGCALSAPSKSDLQQADVIHIADPAKLRAVAALIPEMPWIAQAPLFLVFCGNNRRLRQIGAWRGKPFANDHLDHFMNAAVDAAIVMANFICAAEAVGLGTCPISAIRNHPDEVSAMLELPEWVFPVAGLCAGYPQQAGRITPRLPLEVTVHTDRHDDSRTAEKIDEYDRRRDMSLPYRKQRHVKRYGEAGFYGWSEDKARQYSVPERADWGAFIRGKGFKLD